MKYIPRNFQLMISNFIFDNPRCQIWGSMGIGKTPSTLDAIVRLIALGEVTRVLILAPQRVAWATWIGEVEKFFETFGHLRVARAIGSPIERLNALNSDHDILCINYENIPWLMKVVHGKPWLWDMVIADESTRLKSTRVVERKSKKTGKVSRYGAGSVRGKAIVLAARTKVKRWVNLTGSPAPNGLQDLYGQMYFVDGGQRLGRTSKGFEDRWFNTFDYGGQGNGFSPTAVADTEIKKAIKDVTLTIDAKDYFDLRKIIERNVVIELPDAARRNYRQMETDFFAYLQQHGVAVEANSAAGQRMKMLQICSGFLYDNPDDPKNKTFHDVHSAKLEALDSIVEESNGENIIVRFHFQADRDRILKRFKKAVWMPSKGSQVLDDWNKGKIPMLLLHAQSAGHGLSMQHGGRIFVDYSYSWSLEEWEQSVERIGPTRQAQSGYDRNVFRYTIVAKDTVEDIALVPSLRRKMSVQDGLKEFMKVRGLSI
jgi:SNF2 family DNA or RNA helicase